MKREQQTLELLHAAGHEAERRIQELRAQINKGIDEFNAGFTVGYESQILR